MMPIRKNALISTLLALAIWAGCSSSPATHTAYVTLPGANGVAGFRVNNHSGHLTGIFGSPFSTGMSPASIWVHPSNKFVYVANQSEGNISLLKIDSSTGALTEVMPRTPAGITPVSLVMDSGGNFLFVANETSGTISVYSIDSSSGSLTETSGSPFATNPTPVALMLTPSGKFLYVANAITNQPLVTAYSVAPGAGTLQAILGSPFSVGVGNGPSSLTVDPAEKFLFVTNSLDNTISVLAIDPSGALAPIAASPFVTGTFPISVTVHPSGFLYVANLQSNNISAYSLDPSTGVPTQITNSPFSASGGPVFITVDSGGKFLFVCGETSRTISEFSIDSKTGALTSSSGSATLGSAPTSMFTTK